MCISGDGLALKITAGIAEGVNSMSLDVCFSRSSSDVVMNMSAEYRGNAVENAVLHHVS